MLACFPDARLLTSLVEPSTVPAPLWRAEGSFLQRLPGAWRHHQWLLPLMPLAWRLRAPLTDVDAVISSSHACAKAVRAAPSIPHLCYCYTPMRYAWDFQAEQGRIAPALRPPARLAMRAFRRWDRRMARGVTRFLAISRAVARRVERHYARRADVVHPPVRTTYFTPAGPKADFFLYVGRLVSYKRPDLVVEAFAELPHPLVVVGTGHMLPHLRRRATPNVTFLTGADDGELRSLYRSARALVYPGEEDFGIVMAEAQACGTPVIALARGGAPDIVEHGRTGYLVERQEVAPLRAAVRTIAAGEIDAAALRASSERFSAETFRRRISDAVEEVVHEGWRSRW
jgi:O-antigen biosynthesis alpha-1,3-mannosyltransferase